MILQFVAEAAATLLGNRARSLLTTLGLVIGVAAVIAIQVVGKGTAGAVDGVLGGLNDASFIVTASGRQADFTRAAIDADDIDRAKAAIPNIRRAIPAGNVERLVTIGHARARLGIAADSDVSFASLRVATGRDLDATDVATAAHVCVLSETAWHALFPDGEDPVGEDLRIGDGRYTIVGVHAKPTSGIIPVSFGGDVTVPYTTFERRFLRGQKLFAARFIVTDTARIPETERAVVRFFRDLKQGRAEYQTFDRKTFSSTIDGIFTVLTLVVALVGAVSLVVAGIGIMNVMLVSVTERTREIGVRKAIGATRGQVLAQFFVEALLLSFVGCGIGLAIGLAIGWTVTRYALVRLSGVVAPVPWLQSVAIAVGFATVVTLVFGTYPAWRAARLDPIEALRYE